MESFRLQDKTEPDSHNTPNGLNSRCFQDDIAFVQYNMEKQAAELETLRAQISLNEPTIHNSRSSEKNEQNSEGSASLDKFIADSKQRCEAIDKESQELENRFKSILHKRRNSAHKIQQVTNSLRPTLPQIHTNRAQHSKNDSLEHDLLKNQLHLQNLVKKDNYKNIEMTETKMRTSVSDKKSVKDKGHGDIDFVTLVEENEDSARQSEMSLYIEMSEKAGKSGALTREKIQIPDTFKLETKPTNESQIWTENENNPNVKERRKSLELETSTTHPPLQTWNDIRKANKEQLLMKNTEEKKPCDTIFGKDGGSSNHSDDNELSLQEKSSNNSENADFWQL